MQSEHVLPDHPFKNIALSLSGGGVRAVGYHRGTLDYLHRSGLLDRVQTLSSVSGGSLVGIGYALSLKKGEPFQDFYDNICEFLPELNTLEDLLKILERREPPVASGSRTMITALAEVYRERYLARYYEDPTFAVFWEKEPVIPLKEIIFNATEFKSGFAFRFQKSEHNGVIGNAMLRLSEEHAKAIRMSDIMAASSCIPGGMEPLMFPQDFHWPGDVWRRGGKSERPYCENVENYLRDRYGITSVPLMDGGVYDNQGITSIILTLARRFRVSKGVDEDTLYDQIASLEPIRPRDWARWVLGSMEQASDVSNKKDLGDVDLFIVSDTPILRDPMYAVVQRPHTAHKGFKHWLRNLSLGAIDKFVWVTTFLLAISFFMVPKPPAGAPLPYTIFFYTETVFLFMLMILTVGSLVLIRVKGRQLTEAAIEVMPPMKRQWWSYAKRLRVGQIWDMTTLRATSMSALTSRIFMNRIRQLGYSLLYSHEEFEKRVMDNNINDIGSITAGNSGDLPEFVKSPSIAVQFVVTRAAEMGTKLWIDKPAHERHDLDVLIAAGHVSTCFNVIEYLWQSQRDENGEILESCRELYEFVQADWQRLNENPYWLVDERQQVGREPGKLFWHASAGKAPRRWTLRRKPKQPA
ncbi:MAG: patatin-like phospholipase family protein [Woeseia sp.]